MHLTNKLSKMYVTQIVSNLKQKIVVTSPKSILSPVTFTNIIVSLRWGTFWGGIPYEYHQTRKRLTITKRAVRIWTIFTIAQVINFLYFAGVVIYLIYSKIWDVNQAEEKKTTSFDIAFSFIVTMMTMALLVAALNIGAFQRNEYRIFVNYCLQYCIYLKETYTNKLGAKWRNGCEEFMTMWQILMTVFPYSIILHIVQHPEHPIYMISLVPSDSILYCVSYICYCTGRLLLQLSGSATVIAIFYPIIGFVFAYLNLLHEIKPSRRVYRTKPSFRTPSVICITVRTMQLLANQVNRIETQIIMGEQTLLTWTGTICAISAIHFWDRLTFTGRWILVLTGMSTVGIWTTILTVAAYVYTSSEKAFNSWRNFSWTRFEKKQMRIYRKSVRPIQLEFGGFYYIRPKKVLSFWNTFVWLTVRGLLTFPDGKHNNLAQF